MFPERTFLTSTQIWFVAGIFVSVLALTSWTNPNDGIGIIQAGVERQGDAERLFEIQLNEMMQAEESVAGHVAEALQHTRTNELREVLEQLRKESAARGDRLRTIFAMVGMESGEHSSSSLDGLIDDEQRMISDFQGTPLIDVVVIAGIRKFVHFEISGYLNLMNSAGMLDQKEEITGLLRESLREEENNEEALSSIAERISSAGEQNGNGARQNDLNEERQHAPPVAPTEPPRNER